MKDLIIYLIGGIITFPFLLTVIVYFITKKLYKNKWKAIHFSANYTTIFYIFSVGAIFQVLLGRSFLSYIIITLLILLSIIIAMQWKVKGDIIFASAWKLFWRFTFLLFALGQFILVLIGLVASVVAI